MAYQYKDSVLDIVDAWGGYAVKDPCVATPALNAGVVELKCFINNVCPFHASPYEEDALVFNTQTFQQIKPYFPDGLANVLKTTKGIDGIHFTPRYVFRHNYIYHKNSTAVPSGTTDREIYDVGFETYFDEVAKADIPGVDETRYKAEQTWLIRRSVFDQPCEDPSSVECFATAHWTCVDKPISKTDETDIDIGYDYKLDHYLRYQSSIDPSTGDLIPGQTVQILPGHVQMPLQARIHDDKHRGVHWKLLKRTPVFQGEDFFIRFYKQARETVVSSSKPPVTPSFNDPYYAGLDITATDQVQIAPDVWKPINFAVSPPKVGNERKDMQTFNFFDQAYYIVELGYKSPTDNYFIVIPERGNPFFAAFVQANGQYVSKRYSTFTGISGSQLINADYFDITVRNHLGKLVIEFSGKGINPDPWVVQRLDWIREWDANAEEVILTNKVRSIFVPRGRIALWGGNIRCGFIFGPLQYRERAVSFVYPPKETMSIDSMWSAFNDDSPTEISSADMDGAFIHDPFFLPVQGNHHLVLSSSNIYLDDLGKHAIPVGTPILNQNLFVQDAQYYKEYHEGTGGRRYRGSGVTGPQYGGFFYDETLKEFADENIYLNLKTSNLVVRKNRFMNDDKTRKQAFDILVGMMTGDHLFTSARWVTTIPNDGDYRQDELRNGPGDIPDNQWFVPDCKTPVLSSIRLVSDPSDATRWPDNTDMADGVARTPFDAASGYFIDATDHVMTYSDAWSAGNGWSEVEHTGTLQFYLNRGMPVPNNVTDALLALQNKTFYVEIWAGYRDCNFTKMDGYYKLFTGLCQGGKIDYEYGKIIMSCKVEDYSVVLQGMRMFNAPWFDGVKDINAVHEIMQMAGFREESQYDPGSLIRRLSESANAMSPTVFHHHFDGRLFKSEPYALPSAYNRLEQPAFKAKDGDPFIDIIMDIAKRAGKVFFFDEFGVAHFENPQEMVVNDFLGRVPLVPLYHFTTNPEVNGGQLVFNKVERAYEVDGVINHIKLMSNTPDMHLMVFDDVNWSSMENPEAEGFLGFMKTGYQVEGLFGSKEASEEALRKYKVNFRPYIRVNFETYGIPLRVNDIVRIDGEDCRVVKVNQVIGAEKNSWWMTVECVRYQTVNASRSIA